VHGVGGDPLRGVHRGGLAKPADDTTVDDVLVDLDDLADDQRAQSGESAVRAVAQVAVQTLVGTPLQATTGTAIFGWRATVAQHRRHASSAASRPSSGTGQRPEAERLPETRIRPQSLS
jgi:hypothetical protein